MFNSGVRSRAMIDISGSNKNAPNGIALVLQNNLSQSVNVEAVAMSFGYDPLVISRSRHIHTAYGSVKPALIVTDLFMEDFDGIDVIRWLIAQQCTTDVILTINGDEVIGRAAIAIAANAGLFRLIQVQTPGSVDDLRAGFAEICTTGGLRTA